MYSKVSSFFDNLLWRYCDEDDPHCYGCCWSCDLRGVLRSPAGDLGHSRSDLAILEIARRKIMAIMVLFVAPGMLLIYLLGITTIHRG